MTKIRMQVVKVQNLLSRFFPATHIALSYGIFFACITLFIVQGSIHAFLQPPLQAPDEVQHWLSANRRLDDSASGCPGYRRLHIAVESSRIAFHPEQKFSLRTILHEIPRHLFRNGCAELEPSLVPYGNVLTYPGVLAMKILFPDKDKSLRSTLFSLYSARLIHGLLVALSFTWLLTVLPGGATGSGVRFMLCPLLLSPLFIQQSFAVSADPITFIGMIAFLVMTIRHSSPLHFSAGLILAMIAIHTRPTLLPVIGPACFALLFFSHYTWRRRMITTGLMAVTCLLLAWLPTKNAVTPASASTSPTPWEINPPKQVAHIKENPLKTFAILYGCAEQYLTVSTLTSSLGWLDTHIPRSVAKKIENTMWSSFMAGTILCLIGLSASVRSYRSYLFFTASTALGVFTVLCLAITPVFTMYVMWTPPTSETVLGVQSRYFFPAYFAFCFIPLLAAANPQNKTSTATKPFSWWAPAAIGFIFFAYQAVNMARVLFVLVDRYHT